MCLTGFMARVTMIRSRIAERFPGLPVSGLLRVAYLLHAVNRPAVASARLTVRVGHALDGLPVGRSRGDRLAPHVQVTTESTARRMAFPPPPAAVSLPPVGWARLV
jgi:hypothetical protein